MQAVEPIAIPPELRSTICPNCGYSLAEIPESEQCPECGRKRNLAEIVLYGDNLIAEQRSARTLNLPNGLILYFVGLIAYSFIFSSTKWYYSVFTVAGVVWWRLMRIDNRHPGQMQIRINSEGVTQFLHAGGATTLGKLQAGYIWVLSAVATVALVADWDMNRSTASVYVYAPLVVVMVLLTLYAIRQGYRFHRMRRAMADTAVVDLNMIFRAPTAWRMIREYWITPGCNGWYRLRIDDRKHSPGSFVSAMVQLTPSAAAALNNLLKERILAAYADTKAAENPQEQEPRGVLRTLLSDLGLRR